MPNQLTIKAEGPKPQLIDLIEKLKEIYVVIPTSKFIEHHENNECHIYLTLVEVQ